MSDISDRLREFARVGALNPFQVAELRRIADCIDSEMVELPKDRDGVPIRVGDAVCLSDGCEAEVAIIELTKGYDRVDCLVGSRSGGVAVRKIVASPPSSLAHARPDSWERIADELEEWSEDNRVNGDGDVFERARQFSDRIRKLTKREGER